MSGEYGSFLEYNVSFTLHFLSPLTLPPLTLSPLTLSPLASRLSSLPSVSRDLNRSISRGVCDVHQDDTWEGFTVHEQYWVAPGQVQFVLKFEIRQ